MSTQVFVCPVHQCPHACMLQRIMHSLGNGTLMKLRNLWTHFLALPWYWRVYIVVCTVIALFELYVIVPWVIIIASWYL